VASKQIHLLKEALHLNLYALGGTNIGYQYTNHVKVRNGEIGFITIEDFLQENRLRETVADRNTSNTSNHIHKHYEVSDAINQRVPSDFTGTKYRSFDFTAKWVLK